MNNLSVNNLSVCLSVSVSVPLSLSICLLPFPSYSSDEDDDAESGDEFKMVKFFQASLTAAKVDQME